MRFLSLLAPALALAAACASTACASTEVEWERIEDARFTAEDGTFALELPLGWVRSERALTHDGWEHQTITFNAGAVFEPGVSRPADASSPELLAAMQDELAAQPGIELVELRPATLDGLPAFRMHFRRVAEDGAPAESQAEAQAVLYGAIDGETLYAFSLESASAETFPRDLEAFEQMVASFRRLGVAPATD
jgi:hypothetical protein